ncbi:septum site-determining protein MinC [Methylomonas sp. SURF-2]|uniref:Probable septum site-determining protein MinC n=1 Tax=Methylomonas subterranea TaxID=2952225 RepID=A0ABT1THI9_9GAMM|nr:septum site-determining protein MinC [Methylomonas sp. SURF-2]MCQ8104924.1 septum site-determining protein MinC [Methylomonas sp. SURF-2]
MSTSSPSLQKAALEFKSTSLTVPVLLLASIDEKHIELQLQEKIAQAPEFFKHSPLLIDLQKLNGQGLDMDLQSLVKQVRDLGFLPIGIRGGNDRQNRAALDMNLPVHSLHGGNSAATHKPAAKTLAVSSEVEASKQPEQTLENKLITQPVRSGQRVYAKGDLIVTATVSAGAEIMAEGNIHVYGTLRGRALAGVPGNINSRIFCSDLQAELISIAGIYQLSDDLSPETAHKPVQISLDNQTLIIKDI